MVRRSSLLAQVDRTPTPREFCNRLALASALILIATLVVAPDLARAQQIGTAGAVNPASKGIAGGATRVLEIGSAVVHNERVETSEKGSVQLVFIDKTTMNIGPNSKLVIDEFVYDPSTGTGKMSASLGRGVLRIVGGNISHGGGATVSTPVATIGIRGGVAVISHDKAHCTAQSDAPLCTSVDNVFGQLTVTTLAGQEIIRRPGYGVTIGSAGAAPSVPQPVSQASIDATNRLLTSKGAQTGGYSGSVADKAPNRDLTSRQPWQNPVIASNPPWGPGSQLPPPTQPSLNLTVQNQASKPTVAKILAQNATPKAFALTMSSDPSLGSSLPYLLGSFAAAGNYTVSPVLGYRSAAMTSNGVTIQPIQTMQAGLSINGQGASQTSTLFVAVSSITNSISTGGLRASTRLATNQSPGFASGGVTSAGPVLFGADGLPSSYSVTADLYNSGNGQFQGGNAVSYQGPPPITNYSYIQKAKSTAVPSGLGTDRPAETLSGFVGGLMRTFIFANASAQSGAAAGPAFAVGGSAQIQLDPTQSALQANFNVAALTQSGASSSVGANDYLSGNYQLGSLQGGANLRSAYIDSRNFAAIDATTDPNSASSIQNPLSTVNGAGLNSGSLMMVTADTVGAAAMFPGVNFCDCEYTRWGFWAADTSRNSTNSAQTLADRGPLMMWVAGVRPDIGTIPTTGSATYGGHVIGNFSDGTSQYVAAGNFSNTVNFGNSTGTVSISNLDNRSYSGTTLLNGADPRFFTGSGSTISGIPAGFSLAGSFFRGSTGPAQEMGGNILFQGIGSNYLGSGIFAARR
ncbi:MAG: FecR domain-containing protein [Hyphomicrobiales bacterium]